MNRSRIKAMLEVERNELADVLRSLEAADWDARSLCVEWTVLETAAHLASVVGLTRGGLLARALRYGTGTDGANARSARAWAARGPDKIIASLGDPKRLGLGFFHPSWALTEAVVHHQDIRRGLDRRRTIPAGRLEVALDVLLSMPFLTGASRASRRVSLRATDIDWSRGSGPEVTGPAESILMTLAGRPSALAELSGNGLEVLGRP